MSFESVARSFAAVGASGLVALSLAGAFAACSSTSAPAPPADFCGTAKSSSTTCPSPSDCDTQLTADCLSLPKALSVSTVTAAQNCLESGICGVAACLSTARKSGVPGAAHKKLADDFCQSCAPNLTDCAANFYMRGSQAAGLAVLPYADDIVSAIDDACTGQQGCQAKFTTCAAGVISQKTGENLAPTTADCIVQSFGKDDTAAPVGPDGKPQAVTCTAANCVGCCRDDVCQTGNTSDSCGVSAKACQTCSATSKCTAGACKEPCGPATCSGCCDGDTCVTGAATEKCGAKGAACASCTSQVGSTGVCSNHSCIDGSCQATCTNGCCSATGCQPGTAANACGAGGEGCVDCGVGRTCTNAACLLDQTSLWDVYISFAVVPATNKSGTSWDVLNGLPDPYCNVFTSEGTSVHSGTTSVQMDTTVPFWAETPVKGVKASELLSNTSIELWDSDVDFDDYIGGCALALTPAIFDGSLQNQDCPATSSGVAFTIYFRINPHTP